MPMHPLLHEVYPGSVTGNGPPHDQPVAAGGSLEPRRPRLRLRVTFGFLVTAAMPGIAGGPRGMALWCAIVFASLLAHELGHAAPGLAWGSRATIVLYPLGGSTKMEPALSRGRSIAASLMGPLANLILGLCLAGLRAKIGPSLWLNVAMWVNLGWGALNLLPVLPFDGGRVVLEAMGPARAAATHLVSASVATSIAVFGLALLRSAGLTVVFGAAAFASTIAWIQRRRAEIEVRLGVPARLETARSLLAQERYLDALCVADAAVGDARTNATEARALELLAWSHLGLGRSGRAREALARVRPAGTVDPYTLAAVEAACDRADRAIAVLEGARRGPGLRSPAVKLLVDLHARKDLDRACRVAMDECGTLGPDDTRRVLEAAFDAGAFPAATGLAGKLWDVAASPDDGIAHAWGLVELGRESPAKAALARVAVSAGWRPRPETMSRLQALRARPDLDDGIPREVARILHLVDEAFPLAPPPAG